jgi:hypothetical protein
MTGAARASAKQTPASPLVARIVVPAPKMNTSIRDYGFHLRLQYPLRLGD